MAALHTIYPHFVLAQYVVQVLESFEAPGEGGNLPTA